GRGEGCGFEHLVPFSCKRRGFCPSCGGRRMAELAAHLVDAVLPHVPVRQWVLTLPYRLRYLLAWNHQLCRAVLAVHVRAVLGFSFPTLRLDGSARRGTDPCAVSPEAVRGGARCRPPALPLATLFLTAPLSAPYTRLRRWVTGPG